jgi:hypothetical protein
MSLVAAAVVALLALPAAASTSDTTARGTAATSVPVKIVFTGKGGGRYLDVTRWLEENTLECYARQTADETLSVSWTITWNARIVTRGKRRVLVPGARTGAAITGGVVGTSVRDYCDEPEEGEAEVGPNWPGTTQCDGLMGIVSRGSVALVPSGMQKRLVLTGPQFGSPPKPCELSVRNDQLVAGVPADQRMLTQFSRSARPVSVAVGTHHPRTGSYEATRTCSLFPHRYDGIVYLYDCEDTLIWDGTVTISRVST